MEEEEGGTGERAMQSQRQRPEGSRHSQGAPAATRSWRRQETESPLAYPKGAWPCHHLGFRLLVSEATRMTFGGLEPHMLGSLVTAATGNGSTRLRELGLLISADFCRSPLLAFP